MYLIENVRASKDEHVINTTRGTSGMVGSGMCVYSEDLSEWKQLKLPSLLALKNTITSEQHTFFKGGRGRSCLRCGHSTLLSLDKVLLPNNL